MAVSPTNSASRPHWLWAAALAAALVYASGNNPAPVPGAFVGLDKVAHFCLFGLLATLLVRTGAVWRREAWRGWIAVGAVSLFGISDEWHQSFTPGRAVEFGDWVADTAGAVVAVTLYLRWSRYRRLLETPLRVRPQSPRQDRGSSQALSVPVSSR